jgi:adenylate cyclase
MKRLREYPVGWTGVALLVSGAVVPTFLGAAVIGTMVFWALPTAAALGERHVLLQNLVTSAVYFVIAASSESPGDTFGS